MPTLKSAGRSRMATKIQKNACTKVSVVIVVNWSVYRGIMVFRLWLLNLLWHFAFFCFLVDVAEECLLPRDTGPCRGIMPKWHYDWKTKQCQEFTYGGCQGNDNRFESKEACEMKCHECSPVMCLIHCPYGFEKGKDGCDLCKCYNPCDVSKPCCISTTNLTWFEALFWNEFMPNFNKLFSTEMCFSENVFRGWNVLITKSAELWKLVTATLANVFTKVRIWTTSFLIKGRRKFLTLIVW